MKTFDCNTCKNKQNGVMHCLFYQAEPDIDVCSGYQKTFDIGPIVNEKTKSLIKRRAIDLVNTFQGIGYTNNDWIRIINAALQHNNIEQLDLQTNARFIRSFGANGLTFACDECGDIVELEDDSVTRCPSCGHSDFNLIPTQN